jgi:hypothetical protein
MMTPFWPANPPPLDRLVAYRINADGAGAEQRGDA